MIDNTARDMMNELKPCPNPWCSESKPVLMQGGFRNRYRRIECETCGTHGPQSEVEAWAVTKWNTRVPEVKHIGEER